MSEITNPQDAELEEVVLGACLLESKAITLVADILRPEVFYTETNREIYAVLQGMYHAGQVIDIMTIYRRALYTGAYQFTRSVECSPRISCPDSQTDIYPS